MIRIVKNTIDNGVDTCKHCEFYEPQDLSVGQWENCTHPLLYDDNNDFIKEFEQPLNEAMNDPRHCCLMDITK